MHENYPQPPQCLVGPVLGLVGFGGSFRVGALTFGERRNAPSLSRFP